LSSRSRWLASAAPVDLASGDWQIRLALLDHLSDAPGHAMILANVP
jgi:hypothetical protein